MRSSFIGMSKYCKFGNRKALSHLEVQFFGECNGLARESHRTALHIKLVDSEPHVKQ